MSTSSSARSELSVAMQTEIDSENFGHYSHHSASESVCLVMDGFLYPDQVIWTCQAFEYQNGDDRSHDGLVRVHGVISASMHPGQEHHVPKTGLGP
ncbi:hypothetical protein N7523_008854 [Penicillium sp. IBT 18751x]|nr:hypothetical protein N7523_008854 [Penicillium sp. IBT 18751x]